MLRTQRKFKTVNDIVAWVKNERDDISILKVKRSYWYALNKTLLATWRTVYYKTFKTQSWWEWDTYVRKHIMIIGKVRFYSVNNEWVQCHGESAGQEIEMKASMKKLLYDELIIKLLDSIKVS